MAPFARRRLSLSTGSTVWRSRRLSEDNDWVLKVASSSACRALQHNVLEGHEHSQVERNHVNRLPGGYHGDDLNAAEAMAFTAEPLTQTRTTTLNLLYQNSTRDPHPSVSVLPLSLAEKPLAVLPSLLRLKSQE